MIQIYLHRLIIFIIYERTGSIFKKIKHQGFEHFNESALFGKVFLNFSQKFKKQLPIRRDSTSTCPSVLSKSSFVKQKVPFIKVKSSFLRTIWINSLIFNKQFLNFSYFFFEWSVSCRMRYNGAYPIKLERWLLKTRN